MFSPIKTFSALLVGSFCLLFAEPIEESKRILTFNKTPRGQFLEITTLLTIYNFADEDDAGYRTEINFTKDSVVFCGSLPFWALKMKGAKEKKPGENRPAREMLYRVVYKIQENTVWDKNDPPYCVFVKVLEIFNGKASLYRYEDRFHVRSPVTLLRNGAALTFSLYKEETVISGITPPLPKLKLKKETEYVLTLDEKYENKKIYRALVSVQFQVPGKFEEKEIFDPRYGLYKSNVPIFETVWKSP